MTTPDAGARFRLFFVVCGRRPWRFRCFFAVSSTERSADVQYLYRAKQDENTSLFLENPCERVLQPGARRIWGMESRGSPVGATLPEVLKASAEFRAT
jgi:hypothetical protein